MAENWPQVVLFGASMTERSFGDEGGWGAIIADKLARRCDVLNRGFSGYNTRWGRMILPKLFNPENVKSIVAFILLFGANDSNNPKVNPVQHVPLIEYKKNLCKMIAYLEEIGVSKEKVIIISPPPCDTQAWGKYLEGRGLGGMGMDLTVIGQYAAACTEITKELGVTSINLFMKMQENPDWRKGLCDGLHFAKPGAETVAKLVWPEIEARIKHLPETIFPTWFQVDWENPESSFV